MNKELIKGVTIGLVVVLVIWIWGAVSVFKHMQVSQKNDAAFAQQVQRNMDNIVAIVQVLKANNLIEQPTLKDAPVLVAPKEEPKK